MVTHPNTNRAKQCLTRLPIAERINMPITTVLLSSINPSSDDTCLVIIVNWKTNRVFCDNKQVDLNLCSFADIQDLDLLMLQILEWY